MVWRRSTLIAPTTGEIVPGYRDLVPIGRGGFSVVYRAYQEQLHRSVALKVLSVEVDPPVRRRFLREVKLAGRLAGHPNVVTVLDTGVTSGGRPYLAMELFEGGSLADRLAGDGPLPVPDVLRVGVKTCAALSAAHAEGILHRDVKPQNILISRYGDVALGDFGTARLTNAIDISTHTGALTPYHAAPEVLQGQPPTAAGDVYSLGSTLYQLLSGRPPYQAESGGIAALLLRILRDDPPPLTRPGITSALVDALHRALAKDPAERYPSAAAFADRLREVQRDLGLPPTDTTPLPSRPPDPTPAPPPPGPSDSALPSLDDQSTQPLDVETIQVSRRRWPVVAGLAALVVSGAILPALLHGPAGARPLSATGSRSAPTTTSAAEATSSLVVETSPVPATSARPSEVTTVDGGSSVVLRWQLPPDAAPFNVLIQVDPHQGPAPTILPAGQTTYTITDLDPLTGYCFSVGVLLALGHDNVAPIETWAAPACIRGAVASH